MALMGEGKANESEVEKQKGDVLENKKRKTKRGRSAASPFVGTDATPNDNFEYQG